MDEADRLAARFETHRSHLRGIAYRMLGSLAEADDAVQESWIRLSRAGGDHIDDLGAWLATVVGRICLNMLRSRSARGEASLETHVPDPIIGPASGLDPEQEALVGDAIGLAMLVVLDSLTPAERVAFVLHDAFAVPFDDIANVVDRTPTATRKLASRARRRVQQAQIPDGSLAGQWEVADAFLAAARDGDFERLVAVLDPECTVRTDGGAGRPAMSSLVRGARAVAGQAMAFRRFAESATRIVANGAPAGVAWTPGGAPYSIVALTIRGRRIVEIDVLVDPDRLARLDLATFAG